VYAEPSAEDVSECFGLYDPSMLLARLELKRLAEEALQPEVIRDAGPSPAP